MIYYKNGRNENKNIWTYLFKSWNSGWELTWKMMPWTNSRYLNFEAYTYLVMHNAAVMWCHSKDTRAFPGQTTRLSSDDCVGTSNKCIIQKSYMPFWLTYIANICMYILKSLVGTLSSCQSRESTTIKYTNLSQTTLFFGFYLSASRFNSTTPTFFFYSYQIEIHYIDTYIWYIIQSNFQSEYEIHVSNFTSTVTLPIIIMIK